MFLTIDGRTHHVTIDGSGEGVPLVLLHSLGTSLHLWDLQLPRLAARRRVVRLDMRGHGLSERPTAGFDLDDLAGDVLAVLDDRGIGRFAVAGVSIGGMVAQILATRAADRVERAILIDTSAVTASPAMWRDRVLAVEASGLAPFAEEILSRWVTPTFRSDPAAKGLETMLIGTSVAGFCRCAEALAAADLSTVTDHRVPTLVVVGEHDVSTPLSAAKALAAARNAATTVLPGTAHIPNFERPDALCDAIEGFLEGEANSRSTMEVTTA